MFYKLFIFFILSLINPTFSGTTCRYKTWDWDVRRKKAVNHREVLKPIVDLTSEEKDSHSKCTICEEDQIEINVPNLSSFRVCKYFAKKIKKIIDDALKSGFIINEIVGYRVGKTKGKIDHNGFRTQYSNHSFGTAIDINPKQNGLYTNCIQFHYGCKLIRGGTWDFQNPLSIHPRTLLYRKFKELGWNWGGEIGGKQKDFMHFSITGY